jgi:hypothetical protein
MLLWQARDTPAASEGPLVAPCICLDWGLALKTPEDARVGGCRSECETFFMVACRRLDEEESEDAFYGAVPPLRGTLYIGVSQLDSPGVIGDGD